MYWPVTMRLVLLTNFITPYSHRRITTMAEHTRDFFLELTRQQSFPYMRGLNGTCLFAIDGAGTWHVVLEDGHITVNEQELPADTTVTCNVAVFDQVARGEEHLFNMVLQDKVQAKGNIALLYVMQRLFPAPPASKSRSTPPQPE